MDTNSGNVNFGIPYEYTVRPAESGALRLKRALLIALYVVWSALVLSIAFLGSQTVPLLIVFAVTLPLLVRFTWRYTFVEYEYSFFGGSLTVSRVLKGKSRRELSTVEIRQLSAIVPYDDAHMSQIERFGATKKILAYSSLDAPEIYVLLWTDETKRKYLLCIEPSEKALKILRFYNNSAFCR